MNDYIMQTYNKNKSVILNCDKQHTQYTLLANIELYHNKEFKKADVVFLCDFSSITVNIITSNKIIQTKFFYAHQKPIAPTTLDAQITDYLNNIRYITFGV